MTIRGFGQVASLLLAIPTIAGAQVRSAPLSHHTGADAARVAGPGMNRTFFNNRSFFNGRFNNGGFNRGFGRGRQNVVLVPSFGYPYIGDSYFDNGYDSSNQGQPPVVVVPQTASPNGSQETSDLRRQIDRLSGELDAMHDRQVTAPEAQARVPEQPATLLVYHDQHVEQIHNYAIVGQTLWAFDTGSGTMGRKVPLSDLDLAETAHVNAEHGVRFSTPAAAVQ